MLKKTAVIVLINLLCYTLSNAQTLIGSVLDENKQPVVGASVYFDGTAIGTITNANGQFTLQLKNRISAPLVISSLGYETQLVQNAFDHPNLAIQLKPKPYQIGEVVVKKDRFSRKQKMKAFRAQFLGTSRAGKSCIIKNESDVDLYFNAETNTLVATSDKPLVIVNKHLGYTITVNLVDFNVTYRKTSLNSDHVKSSLFLVTTFFSDTEQNNTKIEKRRSKCYQGSTLNFFRDLSLGKWSEKGFLLYSGSIPAIPSQYFTVSDTLDLKKVVVTNSIKGVVVSIDSQNIKIPFISSFNLLYKNRKQSKIVFKTGTIYIDKYGVNTSPELIQLGGDMGRKRLGDLLPFDYSIEI